MSQAQDRDRDSTRLSDDSAQRLLARATQLDSARAASTSIAELRRAAAEAGIAPEAFEQALREMDAASSPHAVDRPPARPSFWRRVSPVVVTLAIIIIALVLVASFRAVPHLP